MNIVVYNAEKHFTIQNLNLLPIRGDMNNNNSKVLYQNYFSVLN